MSVIIYTISHPVTGEVVYVGATKNLKQRIASHWSCKSGTAISYYIQKLRSELLIPKIEPIDEYEESNYFDFEKYWINQLVSWGFNLLNIAKLGSVKSTNKSKKTYRYSLTHGNKKYKLESLKNIGDIIKVKPANVYSLKTVIRMFYIKNNLSRNTFEISDLDTDGFVLVKRVA